MRGRAGRAALLSVVLAGAALTATASHVAAECPVGQLDPWPSFTEAAPTAARIVAGEVVESYLDDSTGRAVYFRVRVDEVLRRSSGPTLEFRELVRSGAPLKVCPQDSYLRVRVGDVLAFAFDARVASSPDPVLAIAWIHGKPSETLMPGAERLSLARVRALAALPATETALPAENGEPTITLILLLGSGLFGGLVFLRRLTRKPT